MICAFLLSVDFSQYSEEQDYFQSIKDFIQALIEYFGTGLSNLDAIPDVFLNIWEWFSMTFSFIPDIFITAFTWFAIACMLIRFLRW